MRLPLIAIAACVLCALVAFAMGYFYGRSAAIKSKRFDKIDWEKRKPPSAVD
jgi:hypothetical protein